MRASRFSAADGRLSFCNPAFAHLWRLDPAALAKKPRFETLVAQCRTLHDNAETWDALKGFVTSFNDMREGFTRRIERSDGVVLDCTAQSLLDGAALLTFVDVTADVNVERALTDRNKALLAAEKLRNDFIHHVSYELRSPLNNINGFVHLLGAETTGAAQSAPARISRLCQQVVGGAARHHRRHSRSCDHR